MKKDKKRDKSKGIETRVIEVSFGPNRPIELSVGSSVSSIKPEGVVRIDNDYEFVFSIDRGTMVTFSYDGPNNIVRKGWSLNQNTLTDKLVDLEIYRRKKNSGGAQFDAVESYLKEKGFSYK